METLQLLRELSEAHGVSGYEDEPRAITRRVIEPYVDVLQTNALGSLIGLRRGGGDPCAGEVRRSIMLAAHYDEIGLMVTGIEQGFIRVSRVGGVDVRTIVGQEVWVHGRRRLGGIIASLPPHVVPPEERTKVIPLDKLFVDVGLPEAELSQLVRVGDTITFRRDVLELAEGYAAGKAFDDRAGVVAVVHCLELLAEMRHTWDVYAVATSQEEVGLRGAITSAWGLAPDAAIAIDVGFGNQQGLSEAESIAMDGGPAIAIGPNIHPAMYKRLVDVAGKLELKYQVEPAPGRTGTDAWGIQVAREGIPSALLSIPLRYMHTTVETICLRDIERTARLMAHAIASLDEAFAAELGIS
jgi:endoglucanase